jgi:hypothetical protein
MIKINTNADNIDLIENAAVYCAECGWPVDMTDKGNDCTGYKVL